MAGFVTRRKRKKHETAADCLKRTIFVPYKQKNHSFLSGFDGGDSRTRLAPAGLVAPALTVHRLGGSASSATKASNSEGFAACSCDGPQLQRSRRSHSLLALLALLSDGLWGVWIKRNGNRCFNDYRLWWG